MRTIINEIFKIERFDNGKLARYMRCLLKITISDRELSSGLIKEICEMVKQAAAVSRLDYPDHSNTDLIRRREHSLKSKFTGLPQRLSIKLWITI